jgi:hypothetical protein
MKARVRGQGLVHARLTVKRNLSGTRSFTINGETVEDRSTPTFMQGVVSIGGSFGKRSSGRLTPAALSVIDNKLRLTFRGRHVGSNGRQKLYSLYATIGQSSTVQARISRLPSSAQRYSECDADHTESLAHPDSHIHAMQDDAIDSSSFIKVATLSTDADPEWYGLYGAQSNAEILRIVNAAEAIFLRDFGIRFRIVKQHTYTDRSPYSSKRADFLLSQFANNGKNSENLANSPEEFLTNVDLKHLFTGKDLDSSTVGIAYIGTACLVPQRAFGVSQALLYDATMGIFAHEISHNLGAAHDPDGLGTIMYPSISVPPATQFSTFSRDQMRSYLANNSRCFENSNQLAPTPNEPISGTPGAGSDSGLTLSIWQRRPQTSHRSAIRISGTLTDAGSLPVTDVVVQLELRDGTVVAATSTNRRGRFVFNIAARTFYDRRRIALSAITEDRKTVSNEVRITLLKEGD